MQNCVASVTNHNLNYSLKYIVLSFQGVFSKKRPVVYVAMIEIALFLVCLFSLTYGKGIIFYNSF